MKYLNFPEFDIIWNEIITSEGSAYTRMPWIEYFDERLQRRKGKNKDVKKIEIKQTNNV